MSLSAKNLRFRRIVLVVLDSLGIGELPDAISFGDSGSNTLQHLFDHRGALATPTLEKMGLLHLVARGPTLKTIPTFITRMREQSQGKDTTTGHWEMMGLILKQGFQTFPNGFPHDFMREWSEKTGIGYLANHTASGTQIIDQLGEEHQKTGKVIVYTSADSVFQIAAHEESFGLDRLYKVCEQTREILNASPFKVGRVIARPFLGNPGAYKRTSNRHDYSAIPPCALVPEVLKNAGVHVMGIGKIPDIFASCGMSESLPGKNESQSAESTLQALRVSADSKKPTLIFANLNDLDMLYGHRRDAAGYASNLELIDSKLPALLKEINNDDLLVLTADHGNDPTYKGTDHTREYVPLILYSPCFGEGLLEQRHMVDRPSFSDLGATILENFGVSMPRGLSGKSLLVDLS